MRHSLVGYKEQNKLKHTRTDMSIIYNQLFRPSTRRFGVGTGLRLFGDILLIILSI